ncbi:GNAT family N-acetyltransferase [Paenibacillus sp. DMB20]|uniref:GNAT family N-acetyltransferase n=1 Tax=Paenibacillus sp. DMB20 TaxID=1642570 RepID=UPI000627F286|nr:GNAT family protein [Paenibacillus sp. DMB20]KKO52979.1 acetyltransferase [Paenibacillus sp. DMB20]KKO53535.1 acetyltransferase [Paenibacillus sp. DMB20]
MSTTLWNPKPVRFLEGERIYLRPVGQEDAEGYFRMLFNPEMRRLTGTRQALTLEGIRRYIDGKTGDASTVLLLIALRDSDEVIGDIALQDIDPANRNANIRIAIDSEEHLGKGFGPESMRLLLEYGFGILNLHRIELQVFGYNVRAIKAYEKVGFKREGVQRDALYYNHRYHDSVIMSMLEDEFRALYHQQAE